MAKIKAIYNREQNSKTSKIMKKSDQKINAFLRVYAAILPFVGEGEPQTVSKADHEAALADKDSEIKKLSETKTKLEAQIADKTKEFEALRASTNLSSEEREKLEKSIAEIKSQKETTEHQLTQRAEKAEKSLLKREEELSKERDSWKKQFEHSMITRDITDAAAGNKAHQPRQLVDMLGGKVRVVEIVDDKGVGTGRYESRIKYTEKDNKGKDVELDLTVGEAVKKMRDSDDYFNLFDNGERSGPGTRRKQGEGTSLTDIAKTGDPKAYREARKAGAN